MKQVDGQARIFDFPPVDEHALMADDVPDPSRPDAEVIAIDTGLPIQPTEDHALVIAIESARRRHPSSTILPLH